MKLADTLDLGSSAQAWGFKSLAGHQILRGEFPLSNENINKNSYNTKPQDNRPTNLEIADQMFKDAFLVKMTRFSHLHPELTPEELHKMTVQYFINLNDDAARGKL